MKLTRCMLGRRQQFTCVGIIFLDVSEAILDTVDFLHHSVCGA